MCRRLAKDYGWTPEQIAEMPDSQLYDMIPNWHEGVIKVKGKAIQEQATMEAIRTWKKDNPNREPDYFADIVPLMNRMATNG